MRPQSESKTAMATEADRAAWASVPWTRQTDPGSTANNSSTIGWYKAGVPYLPLGSALDLQTLDAWLPAADRSPSAPVPPADSLPRPAHGGGTWIVYIHGGAWRDPRISASSFSPTATQLLLRSAAADSSSPIAAGKNETRFAGLISLNYRLSPHPSHPSDSPSRAARHPDHIADVRAALDYLARMGIPSPASPSSVPSLTPAPSSPTQSRKDDKLILTGHSCGATLAFQSLMDPARWGLSLSSSSSSSSSSSPSQISSTHTKRSNVSAAVGFNGLYDLAGFIARPAAGYEALRDGYREFTAATFGEDEGVWRAVCPASAEGDWVREWVSSADGGGGGGGGGGEVPSASQSSAGVAAGDGAVGLAEETGDKKKVVVLVQSRGDTLVPWDQVEALRKRLEREEHVRLSVLGVDGGDHDEMWQKGGKMAEVLWNVVEGL